MKPFLKDLAETFLRTYDKRIADFCFILPNKRGGVFLQNYFSDAFKAAGATLHDVLVMPRIITISDFVSELSGLVIDSRLDMLFSLFRLYRLKDGADTDFDRFKSWGEIALSDFNDVDMFCVDSDKLFRNLTDLKSIETDFLNDEQKEIVGRYFPSYNRRKEDNSFWKHFNADSDTGAKYLRLWETMGVLYHELNADLEIRGLCTSGGAYRHALERIENNGLKVLPYKQVVFVGFNALTTIEYRIFNAIKKITIDIDGEKQSLGDFYWDAVGRVLNGKNSAAHFVVNDMKHFPSKLQLEESSKGNGFPANLKIIACPGNTIQTRVVSELLNEIMQDDKDAVMRAGGTVVAMPDEGLFFPMLYSLPSELDEVNITMGYPLKVTATFSWMRLLRNLHTHSRMENGQLKFIREDLLPLLSHPITRVLTGSEFCHRLLSSVNSNRYFMVGTDEIKSVVSDSDTQIINTAVNLLFAPFNDFKTPIDLCYHLLDILGLVLHVLSVDSSNKNSVALNVSLERDNVHTYMDAVHRFIDAVKMHGIGMHQGSVFSLLNSLLASETISLIGEPLCGVQIMGMLETRSLDFENVIITSMNERVFPRRLRNRSFIPNSLRIDYGLATTRFQESIFAYYFYRMISRAKNVWLLYDSRSGGLRSGDPSRYIYQLRYLYPDISGIVNQTRSVSIVTAAAPPLEGVKTPEVMARLNEYITPDSGKTLSASSLKTYLKCPLQFYFKNIKHLKVKEEEVESMTSAQQGTIFHDTMNELYQSLIPQGDRQIEVTVDMLQSWLDTDTYGNCKAAQTLKNMILREYLHTDDLNISLQGYAEIYFHPIYVYVKNTIEADKLVTPFIYLGGEQTEYQTYPLNDGSGREVNMKYIIDRIDRVNDVTRLIDYKTGSDVTEFSKLDEVFRKNHAIFQLMLYASLYDLKQSNTQSLKLCIAKPALLKKNGYSYDIKYCGNAFDNHLELKAEFDHRMSEIFNELFDENQPFTQCPDRTSQFSPCNYCDYVGLCRLRPKSVAK